MRLEPDTPEGFAERLELHPRGVRRVLDALVAVDVAERDGSRYRPSAQLAALDRTQSGGIEVLSGMLNQTPALLRTGMPVVAMDGAPATREFFYAEVVEPFASTLGDAPSRLADQVPERSAILDIGAGAGIWSLAMAQKTVDAKVTALDFPRVLDVFRDFANRAGLSQRVETMAGNYHQLALPSGRFDRVVLANVLHLESEEMASALVRQAAQSLLAGGDLVIVDMVGGDSAEEQRGLALYSLHLALRTEHGKAHTLPLLQQWLTAAGLSKPVVIPLGSPPGMAAVVAMNASRPTATEAR
ncbi:MAG: class I SAM-dependent methyltransferase [Acidobacteriota bacterium]